MFDYLYGKIVEIRINRLVIDVNGVGYALLIAHPENYRLNEERKVYVYLQIKEDDALLFGFSAREEKNLFLSLLTVSGIGPKTALNILANSSARNLKNAIAAADAVYLKRIPGVGPRVAQQIILDLQGKLSSTEDLTMSSEKKTALSNVREALKGFGFKAAAIDKALAELVKEDLDDEVAYLRRALQLLRK